MQSLHVARRRTTGALAAVLTLAVAAPALAQDTEVTVGSRDSFAGGNAFSQNKQNEPAVAVNPDDPSILAAGANDNIDLESCDAGDPPPARSPRAWACRGSSSRPTAAPPEPNPPTPATRPAAAW